MPLFVVRLAAYAALLSLYAMSPLAGVAALAGGYGYVIGQRALKRPGALD